MAVISRRHFHQATLDSLLTFSLLEFLFARDSFGAAIQPITGRWLADLDSLGRDLKGGQLTQLSWQEKVEQLLGEVDLPALLEFIDFDKLQRAELKERGESSVRMKFPEVEGLPTKLVFGHQMFALGKGRSVAPHGHNNMATAFLVLKGDFHGRHYERLQDEGKTMIVRPTIDQPFGPGEYSTISDQKDNVHWFTATSETAFLFNIHIMGVKPGRSGRVYIDPHGEELSDGRMRVRQLSAEEAYRLYG
jgi:hypothetical protein